MTIITNAGADERIAPAQRRRAEQSLVEHGVGQDLDATARAAALRRERPRRELLTLEAQRPISLDMGDGEQRSYQDVVVDFEVQEPDYTDMELDTLWTVSLRPREDAAWPFRPSAVEGRERGPGIRPTLLPGAWEQVFDVGSFCMRCFGRMREPRAAEACVPCKDADVEHEEGAHTGTCFRCGLTPEHRARAIDYLNRVGELSHVAGASREVRRGRQRVQRSSGLVLPGQTW